MKEVKYLGEIIIINAGFLLARTISNVGQATPSGYDVRETGDFRFLMVTNNDGEISRVLIY